MSSTVPTKPVVPGSAHLPSPHLNARCARVLARVREEVADFVLDALYMNDPVRHANGSYPDMVFRNLPFVYREHRDGGDLEISLTDDQFYVSVLAHGAPYPTFPERMTGAELEDFLIELADI